LQSQRALHVPCARGTSSAVLTETFVQPEHLFMHACTQVNVRAACATAGTSEQDVLCWAVTCVWSSATTHRDHVLDKLGRKLVIYLGEQHLMRNFAVVMIKAEE